MKNKFTILGCGSSLGSPWITNYKGKLIEFCHSKNIENPLFLVKDITGPDHQRTFEIQVKIGVKKYSSGMGTNKKTAEQIAAKLALEEMGASF